jgi:hypothetical protein
LKGVLLRKQGKGNLLDLEHRKKRRGGHLEEGGHRVVLKAPEDNLPTV